MAVIQPDFFFLFKQRPQIRPGLPGPGRFHRRIECQDIGLECDAVG